MCRCLEYVDDDREAEDDRHLREQEERLDALVVRAAAEQPWPRRRRRTATSTAPREVPGVELRAAVDQQRDHDQRDHAEDDPGRAGVRAVEAAGALLALGRVAHPVDREPDEADQHGDGEEVLEEPEPARVAEEREREVLADDQRAQGLDDRRAEDDEAPEREEVREPGRAPLEQLLLPEHLDDLALEPLADVVGATLGLVPERMSRTSQTMRRPAIAAVTTSMHAGQPDAQPARIV